MSTDWDFGPVRKWIEEAMKTSGDISWPALAKWVDKCEGKFNELQSEANSQVEQLQDMDHQIVELEWTRDEHVHLVEDLLDVPRGITTLPEILDELDGTGWRFGHLANGKDNPAYLPRVRPRKEAA